MESNNAPKTEYITGKFQSENRSVRTIYTNYIINYYRPDCPLCHETLEPDVNFIRDLGQLHCIQGRYCRSCGIFISRDYRQLRCLIPNGSRSPYYTLHDDFRVPSYDSYKKLLTVLPSALAAVHLRNLKNHTIFSLILVRDPHDSDPQKHVFHYGDPTVRDLIWSVKIKKRDAVIEQQEYEILKIDYQDEKHPETATDYILDVINLKSGGGICNAKSHEGTCQIMIYSKGLRCLQPVMASKDEEGRYYLDLSVYERFVAQYGMPDLSVYANKYGNETAHDYRRSETVLTAMGYSVSQNMGYSEAYRHFLLMDIMDLGILSSNGILEILKYNISSHKDKKYIHAVQSWTNDAEFVSQYHADTDKYLQPGKYRPIRYRSY